MPYRRRYGRRRATRKPGWGHYSAKAFYKGAKGFGRLVAGPVLASVAKRYIQSLGTYAAPTVVNSAAAARQVLTQIPRNLAETSLQMDDRVGRKVFIKGVTCKFALSARSGMLPNAVRFLLVRQLDPADTLALTDVYAPVGATRGIQVLWDKFTWLDGITTANGRSNIPFSKFIKVNKMLRFEGDQIDGTDTDAGTLVMYHLATDATGYNLIGSATIHYRELV